eukprot:scaffold593_cov382-Prasinococcus_capsulatus_cf.AAC.24
MSGYVLVRSRLEPIAYLFRAEFCGDDVTDRFFKIMLVRAEVNIKCCDVRVSLPEPLDQEVAGIVENSMGLYIAVRIRVRHLAGESRHFDSLTGARTRVLSLGEAGNNAAPARTTCSFCPGQRISALYLYSPCPQCSLSSVAGAAPPAARLSRACTDAAPWLGLPSSSP